MPPNELKFRINRDDEIVLPAAIIDGDLTLAELGAIFLLATIEQGAAGFDHPRLQHPDTQEAIKLLKNRGIFNVVVEGNKVSIAIELDKAMPPEDAASEG